MTSEEFEVWEDTVESSPNTDDSTYTQNLAPYFSDAQPPGVQSASPRRRTRPDTSIAPARTHHDVGHPDSLSNKVQSLIDQSDD